MKLGLTLITGVCTGVMGAMLPRTRTTPKSGKEGHLFAIVARYDRPE